jgi:hypothetical protein
MKVASAATRYRGWNQKWRKPLRDAFDWLRDTLAPRFETKARDYLKDPWTARDEYVSVVLDGCVAKTIH